MLFMVALPFLIPFVSLFPSLSSSSDIPVRTVFQFSVGGCLISLESHKKRMVNVQVGGIPAATMFHKDNSTR